MHWHSAIHSHLKDIIINSPWKLALLTLKLLFIRVSIPFRPMGEMSLLATYMELVFYASGLFSYLMDTVNRIIHC